MLCFEKYFFLIILSVFLTIFPLPIHADSLTPLPSSPAVTVASKSQRAFATFAPTSRLTSRIISQDTLWSGAIQVDGMVTVAAQATLTIMPGTVVRFGADSGIFVLGRIVAKGSLELPITLASQYSKPAQSDWYGIVLTGTTKKNIFEHLQIQGAETAIYARFSSFELQHFNANYSSVAIKLDDSIASIKETAISGCSTGISAVKSEIDLESVVIDKAETALSVVSSSLTATKLNISSSSQSAFLADKSRLNIAKSSFSGNVAGVMVIGSEGNLSNSSFLANSETAVILSGSLLRFSSNLVSGNKIGIQLVDNLPSIWGNSIYANSSYNLLYLGEGKLYAGGNWLGSVNLELINKSIFSKIPAALQLMPLLATNLLSGSTEKFLKADK